MKIMQCFGNIYIGRCDFLLDVLLESNFYGPAQTSSRSVTLALRALFLIIRSHGAIGEVMNKDEKDELLRAIAVLFDRATESIHTELMEQSARLSAQRYLLEMLYTEQF